MKDLFSNAVSRIRPTTATPTGLRPATPGLRPPPRRACGVPTVRPPLPRACGPPLQAYGPHPGGPAARHSGAPAPIQGVFKT
eukprot:1193134-Prorocentrum_minimum.AAC.1